VDLWDMERAKDGLYQYLDFLSVIADIPRMRSLLIEWEAIYELITLLYALEAGVARRPLVDPPPSSRQNYMPRSTQGTSDERHTVPTDGNTTPVVERPYDPSPPSVPNHPESVNGGSQNEVEPGPMAGLPPHHDTPHKFPWAGIKIQILIILTSLVAPPEGRRAPGNPTVQKQLLKYGGIMALLNCCVYDGHNEYLKERATLALKWVMDGCDEAQQFVRELSPLKNQNSTQQLRQPAQPGRSSTPNATPGVENDVEGSAATNGALQSITNGVSELGVPLSPRSDAIYQEFCRLKEQSRALSLGK